MQVLVVGATGALRPAVAQLAQVGHVVYALSRRPDTPAENVIPVAADYTDLDSLASALERVPRMDAALVYAPTAPDAARAMLAAAVDGTVVELRTSAQADPAVNPSGAASAVESVGVPLLLGWTDDGRWHTPAQLSDAAIASLHDPRPRALGVIRPWESRPT